MRPALTGCHWESEDEAMEVGDFVELSSGRGAGAGETLCFTSWVSVDCFSPGPVSAEVSSTLGSFPDMD